MKKFIIAMSVLGLITTSCVSKKKYAELEARNKQTEDLLNTATVKLNMCLDEKNNLTHKLESMKNQNDLLKENNQQLINNMGNLTTLTQKGAENLEKSLESLREKDLTIKNLRDAVTRRDSVNLALVQSLKGVLGNLDDQDVDIRVEKGVVFINISDKMLFSSGSYTISKNAKSVLEKVAKVVKNKPDFEFMVEGHTDNVNIKTSCIRDNWDLSVMRATEIVRVLQKDFGVAPERMTAAGRSYYVPLASNGDANGRALNRRTRIVVLPKLDQFYTMIEEGMKDPSIGGKGK
ncbi:OmpA family protein [Capnocytophaga ochracea F0287]|uniref:OmpA family protein n=1 Tax=Capnocytophaga ochracea F0287 TaxID=873517 RepID=E4MNZ3_CAPOC|nr:OmpA family protein [Capnocytophaga ochracea]EFS98596.1 OmpA family protein [Capnocytophaga ochracea F0287]EJF42893.1 OmpA family protein [Capnocytophaga ochracea str. Holt 25]UEB43158.1 OmpA family protein [Capnocytophaga ochracea]